MTVSKDSGYGLMAAVFEVHRTLGGGLAEEIYQQSLEHEFSLCGLPFVSKPSLRVCYKGRVLEKSYVPDLLVGGEVVVELKAVNKLLPEHEAQLINYLRISGHGVGYLVNFAPLDRVEWKRLVV